MNPTFNRLISSLWNFVFLVRYTGLLVLVGIGVGLSSYVIYKILARFGKGNNGSSDIKRKKLPKRIRSKSFELEVCLCTCLK